MKYINRDISWLGFNRRVLEEAADASVPLMERVRFLSIFSSNLDEFFRVRYPVLSAYDLLNKKTLSKFGEVPMKDHVKQAQGIIDAHLRDYGNIIQNMILPEFEKNKIKIYYNEPIPSRFNAEIREIFFSRILSFIRPIYLHNSFHDFRDARSNEVYLLVVLSRPGNRSFEHAVINIPTGKVGRFFSIFSNDGWQHIIFLDDIIRNNLSYLFSGFGIKESYSFKITRDAELYLDEENVRSGILEQIEKKIKKREKGQASRFLFERGMPLALQKLIAGSFKLNNYQVFEGGRYHNLVDFASLPVSRKELNYPAMKPLKVINLHQSVDIFKRIDEGDLLLHFPYQSYNAVLLFFNQAAIDPGVKSIYIALYRVADDSHIINALISASKNKKEVVVFVELKARFDEANNIKWSKEMTNAGIRIAYSMPGIKVHSKIALVEKENSEGAKKEYAFIGTGNFNEKTARFYTDHALLTCDKEVTDDLSRLFRNITKKETPVKKASAPMNTLLVSRNNMVKTFEMEIAAQVKQKKKGLPAGISLKLNNLEDRGMIDQLYAASRAGVPVRLLIRGICCLVPGVEGLSEHIEVRRIVDRYLEHSRICMFGVKGAQKIYFGSADWMTRNLHKRIEVCAPVKDALVKEQLETYFEIQWSDNVKATCAENKRICSAIDDKQVQSQLEIYSYLKRKGKEVGENII